MNKPSGTGGRRSASGSRTLTGLLLCSMAVFGLLAGACASDDAADDAATVADDTGPASPDNAGTAVGDAAAGSDTAADRGWIGGEPEWSRSRGSDSDAVELAPDAVLGSFASSMAPDAEDYDMADSDEAASTVATTTTAASTEHSAKKSELPGDESDTSQRKLTGGSIDDNEQFDDYLAYRARIKGLGIAVRDLDPSGRIVVTVTGQGGLPAAGAEVAFSGGGVQAVLRTTADGTVRFHPEAHGAAAGPFTVTAGGATTQASRGDNAAIDTELPTKGSGSAIPIDILFLLDATGSMGDEIAQLKATITQVAQRVHQLSAQVDARLAMTLYRDQDDAFVTATHDFTSDVGAFAAALADVEADGGGDYPEALDEALAEALAEPAWRPPADTLQLVFLVADAPPQINRQVPTPYTASMLEAAGRGVKLLPVSSSGTDDQAEYVFRQLAQFTGGRYVFLTYGAEGKGAATGTSTDITQLDYEDLSLDDLIVRLIAEEVAALTGNSAATAPEPAPPPPGSGQTNPQGPPPQQQPTPTTTAPPTTTADPAPAAADPSEGVGGS